MTLLQILTDLSQAIENKDRESIFGAIIENSIIYFKNAFESIDISKVSPMHMSQSDISDILDQLQNSKNVTDEFKTLINGDNFNKISLLLILLDLAAKNLFYQSSPSAELESDKLGIIFYSIRSLVAEKSWFQNIELYDLKFLSGSTAANNQTIRGKPQKENQAYPPFQSGLWTQMIPHYFKIDAEGKVSQLTSKEKKEFKIRLDGDQLFIGTDIAKEGTYLYVITPKGALYAMSEDNKKYKLIQHSTIRGGQPVLCAGHISIQKNEVTDKMRITSMDRNSGHYIPPIRNFLLSALWLYDQKIIDQDCALRNVSNFDIIDNITIKQLLTLDRFKGIRDEYQSQKLEDDLTSKKSV